MSVQFKTVESEDAIAALMLDLGRRARLAARVLAQAITGAEKRRVECDGRCGAPQRPRHSQSQ